MYIHFGATTIKFKLELEKLLFKISSSRIQNLAAGLGEVEKQKGEDSC